MSDFIEKAKAHYKTLTPTFCKALQETVHFNSDGVNHLLYKDRRPRSHNERHYRMGLIKYLTSVIINATAAVKDIKSNDPLVVTWSIEHEITDQTGSMFVKVILKKEGAGRLTFLSAMSKRRKGAYTKKLFNN